MKEAGGDSKVDQTEIRKLWTKTLLSELPTIQYTPNAETDICKVGESVEELSDVGREFIIL